MDYIIAIITAILGAIFGAIFGKLVEREGIAGLKFWQPRHAIRCSGIAQECKSICIDGTSASHPDGLRYELSQITIRYSSTHMKAKGNVCARRGTEVLLNGTVEASGPMEGDFVCLTYQISDPHKGVEWSALALVRLAKFGDITGTWMSKEHLEDEHRNGVSLGTLTLTRE